MRVKSGHLQAAVDIFLSDIDKKQISVYPHEYIYLSAYHTSIAILTLPVRLLRNIVKLKFKRSGIANCTVGGGRRWRHDETYSSARRRL